jgi:hypothetical protein
MLVAEGPTPPLVVARYVLAAVEPVRLLPVKLVPEPKEPVPRRLPLEPLDPKRLLPLLPELDPVPMPELVPNKELPEELLPPVCANACGVLSARMLAAAKSVATTGKVCHERRRKIMGLSP